MKSIEEKTMRTIISEEGEPTVEYKIPLHERAASLLVWLASRENKTAPEYIQGIVNDFLHSTLTMLSVHVESAYSSACTITEQVSVNFSSTRLDHGFIWVK
jgi:hypothetical protein